MIIAMLAAALAAPAAAAPAPAAPMTIQAQFDKATADYDAGRCSDAVEGFAALSRRVPPTSKSVPLIALRQGAALVCIGRAEEGTALLRSGLEQFAQSDDPHGERAQALLALGLANEQQLDYAAAAREFRAALALMASTDVASRVSALSALARVTTFEDSPAALAAIDQAIALVATIPDPTRKNATKTQGQLLLLRGRILLNRGDFVGGRSDLTLAMTKLGGLTTKVDMSDLSVRGDLAIAAFLSKDEEAARKYLAYTGAGHLTIDLPSVADKLLPPCGYEGVKPEDFVVVQFAIRPDGTVVDANPIYASRPGSMALTFARAVAGWSWTTDQVAKINPFFRAQTRLELRCTNGTDRPQVAALLRDDIATWVQDRKIAPFEPSAGSEAQALLLLKAELARREGANGKDDPALLPVLLQLAANPAMPADERVALAERADTIAHATQAPPAVRAAAAMAGAGVSWAKAPSQSAGRARALRLLNRALAEPDIAGDSRVAGVLRLYAVDIAGRSVGADERIALLKPVSDDDRLPATDAIRVGAELRLASAFSEAGDLAAARSAYERTGLTDQQCALVDAQPSMKGNPASSSDFPDGALAWGFDGWVVTEFDIDSKGRTQGARAVVAYPPFVFDRSAASVYGRARYTQTYRPDGGLGCHANNGTVQFRH